MALFAKQYAIAMGIEDRPQQKPGPLLLIGPALCIAISVVTSALLMDALGISSFGGAILIGFVVGVGYLSTMTMAIAINPLFPHPFRYALINVPYFLINSVISCCILGAFR